MLSKEQIQNDGRIYLPWVKLPTSPNLIWKFKITIWSAGTERIRE